MTWKNDTKTSSFSVFYGLVKSLSVFTLASFVSFPLSAEAMRQQMGIGMECGFVYFQDQLVTQQETSNTYTATNIGNPYLKNVEIGPTLLWDVELVPDFSIGIRSTLLLFGPSFPYNLAPRFNVRLSYEFTDWLSSSVEFPYSPGIGLTFFKQIYLYMGTDSLIVPKTDFVITTVISYCFPL